MVQRQYAIVYPGEVLNYVLEHVRKLRWQTGNRGYVTEGLTTSQAPT